MSPDRSGHLGPEPGHCPQCGRRFRDPDIAELQAREPMVTDPKEDTP